MEMRARSGSHGLRLISLGLISIRCQSDLDALLLAKDIFQVFLARLLPLIEAYAVDEVLLTVGSEPWAILVLHRQLDRATFEKVLIPLHLQDFDYVLPVVSLDLEVYLIMFEGIKNCENVCNWSRIFGA